MNYIKMINIYKDKATNDINKNLLECSMLRGTYFMPLRTLREFTWFCDAILYKEYLNNDFRDLFNINVVWWKYFNDCYPHINQDDYLISVSKLFLKYCIVVYYDLELEP